MQLRLGNVGDRDFHCNRNICWPKPKTSTTFSVSLGVTFLQGLHFVMITSQIDKLGYLGRKRTPLQILKYFIHTAKS